MLIVILLCATAASAVPVTVQFTGEVSVVGDFGVDVGSVFSVGQAISGTFTYDNATPSSSTSVNGANFDGALTGLTVDIGGYLLGLGAGNNGIQTANDEFLGSSNGDSLSLSAVNVVGSFVDGTAPSLGQLRLEDTDNAVFFDDTSAKSLVPTYNFSEFEAGSLLINFIGSDARDRGQVTGTLSNIAVVPEPASLALIGLSGAVILLRQRLPTPLP